MNGKCTGKSVAKPRFQIVQMIVLDHSFFSNTKFIVFEFWLSSVA